MDSYALNGGVMALSLRNYWKVRESDEVAPSARVQFYKQIMALYPLYLRIPVAPAIEDVMEKRFRVRQFHMLSLDEVEEIAKYMAEWVRRWSPV